MKEGHRPSFIWKRVLKLMRYLRIGCVVALFMVFQIQVYGNEPIWGGVEVIGTKQTIAPDLQKSLRINIGDTVDSAGIDALRSMCELAKGKLGDKYTRVECQLIVLATNDMYVVVGVESITSEDYERHFDSSVRISNEAIALVRSIETENGLAASDAMSYNESLSDLLECAHACGTALHREASITLLLHDRKPTEEICRAIVRAMRQDVSSSVRNAAAVQLGKPLSPCSGLLDDDTLFSAAASLAMRSTYSDRLKGLGLITRFKPTESVETSCSELNRLRSVSTEAANSVIELLRNIAGHARPAIDNAIRVKKCNVAKRRL